MFLFSVLLLFLLVCCAGWLLLFPGGRDAVLQSMAALGRRMEGRCRGMNAEGAQRASAFGAAAQDGLARGRRLLRRHALSALAAGVLLTVPPLVALLVSGHIVLPGFDGPSREVNLQVAELLRGEQLAPPVPPPPLAFATAEVTLVRPMLGGANRNWLLLDHEFSQRLLLVFKIMREQHGYEMALLEGYRSPERQNMLADAGSSVTNAKAFQSYHQFGLAADCAFLRDGKVLISERDPWAMRGYRLYGEVAESVGLHWGGRWTMMDFGHAELRVAGKIQRK